MWEVIVLTVNRGGLPAHLIGQYRDSRFHAESTPFLSWNSGCSRHKYLQIPCRDRSNGWVAQPVAVLWGDYEP